MYRDWFYKTLYSFLSTNKLQYNIQYNTINEIRPCNNGIAEVNYNT